MKRVISILSIILVGCFLQSCNSRNESAIKEYVDLGLPSGTQWKQNNETEQYTYDDATRYFDGSLPTYGQFQELINYCVWEWTGNGCKVTGTNGKSIFLSADFMSNIGTGKAPAAYWSSTKDPNRNDCCFGLLFGYDDDDNTVIRRVDRTCQFEEERSVILCKKKK